MASDFYAGDKLLDAWLSLTSTLWNTRLVTTLTFNEAHVLGILLRHQDDVPPVTATALIGRTHLLKSQMNKVLTDLEHKGFIVRSRAESDRRMIHIHLTPEGEAAYRREHAGVETILSQLLARIGPEKALSTAEQIGEITEALQIILSDKGAK